MASGAYIEIGAAGQFEALGETNYGSAIFPSRNHRTV
jgi:hypothetical protein